MSDTARFKINARTREVEIEGTEAFVERQIQQLESLFDLLGRASPNDDPEIEGDGSVDDAQEDKSNASKDEPRTALGTFGEWMLAFKSDLGDMDKALIAARYVQSLSSDNDFKTSDVNKALEDHGIKISNPSLSLKRLGEKKLMFQTRKVGKLRFMRVSTDGQKELDSLKAG